MSNHARLRIANRRGHENRLAHRSKIDAKALTYTLRCSERNFHEAVSNKSAEYLPIVVTTSNINRKVCGFLIRHRNVVFWYTSCFSLKMPYTVPLNDCQRLRRIKNRTRERAVWNRWNETVEWNGGMNFDL